MLWLLNSLTWSALFMAFYLPLFVYVPNMNTEFEDYALVYVRMYQAGKLKHVKEKNAASDPLVYQVKGMSVVWGKI